MSPVALGRAELVALVDEARRAPSVHNIQPARWSIDGARIALRADPNRALPIADPTGHDVRVSLGASCEGMAIALARGGYVAGEVEVAAPGIVAAESSAAASAPPSMPTLATTSSASSPIAWISLDRGARPDRLAASVLRRAAYRGNFARTDPATIDRLARALEPAEHVVVRDRARIRELARLADRASGEFLLDPGYWRETWQWLRLSRSDPRWDRDGLNAESLALSGVELALGRVLMAPPAFEAMRKLGLAGPLISERSKIESAAALVLFTAPGNEDPFDTGRSFYRAWLEVTASGLALCPISALADSTPANDEIRRLFAIAAGRRLVNVFRVGAAPAGFPRRLTPRLPAEELVTAS